VIERIGCRKKQHKCLLLAADRRIMSPTNYIDQVTPVQDLDLGFIDITTIGNRDELRAAINEATKQHWLIRTPLGYLVTRHEDVTALLRERKLWNLARLLPEMSGVPEMTKDRRPSILSMEGDDHTRIRRLVAPAFSPKATDRLRPFMRQVINELVGAFVDKGAAEFVTDVCEPYPIPIICELLGAPKEDWRLFSKWATDLLRIFNNNLVVDYPVIAQARKELDEYVTALISDRRHKPADDLLTNLIAAEEAGDRLLNEELVSMTEAVIVAGTDTTRNQLACAVALFCDHPDQWARLATEPELAITAVEESMRFLGAVRGTGRYASEDVEYRDVLFTQGTMIFPSLMSANFDTEVFDQPETFDITRPGVGTHMTFGSGIHYCLGASLARAELQEALPILAARLPKLRRNGETTWKPNTFGIWGPETLPIAFR
jgi:cytochrome P450